MMNNSISSPIFWMYFSYVLSFIIPLFCGLTLLTVKGAISSEQAGMHPRRLLGIIFTFSGLIFIPNMIQDIHKYITGELGLPIFDIAINLFLVPLYFFYFRKLSKPEKLTSRRIWPHLMPGILVLIISFFLSPLQEKVLKRQLTFNYFPLCQPNPSSHHDHDIHASHSTFKTKTHATIRRELFFHGRH